MKSVDLLNSPIDSSLRKFALPLISSFLINILYTWIDMYFVSKIGKEAISALGVSEQLLFVVFGIGSGLGIGTGIVIARRIGEGRNSDANYVAVQGLVFMFISSVLLAFLLFFSMSFVLDLMEIEGLTKKYIEEYLTAMAFGVPFNFMIFQANAIARATGNSNFQLITISFTIVLNIIFAPILIFGFWYIPAFGVFGAGLATCLAEIFGAILAISLLLLNKTDIRLNFHNYKIDYKIFKLIARLGIYASLQILVVGVNRVFLVSIANSFSTNVLATYMIGLRIDFFVFMFILAMGVAIEVTTGQNLGANNINRIFKYHRSAIKQLSILLIVLSILIFFFGESFAKIYTTDLELVQMIDIYFKFAIVSYIPFSIGIISIRVISGAGDYLRSLLIVAMILLGIQLPLAYILSHYTALHELGIWLGILLSQICFAIWGIISLNQRKWLKVRV